MITRMRVQSETTSSTTYLVTTVLGEPVACTCPHFNFRAESGRFECKHMRSVRETVEVVRLAVRG